MASSSKPNVSAPNHVFDKTKQYKKVMFQQGKPVLDIDLNDMSDALLAQSTAALAEKMGFGPSQLDVKEWALLHVKHGEPQSARNADNFALSLGKLDTLSGVIDTSTLKGDGLDDRIIFDYGKVLDSSAGESIDRQFANYILKGTITTAGDSTTLIDENKSFNDKMGLTGLSASRVIAPLDASTTSVVNTSTTSSFGDLGVVITEGAARVRFITGDNAGLEAQISSISSDGVTLTLGAGLTNPISVGDQYVIIPANSLETYRALYDATQTQAESYHDGLDALPRLVTYVQAFEEDISSEEDVNIKSSMLGQETTHRTELRWCVRVALVKFSKDGETLNGSSVSSLTMAHIFSEIASTGLVDYEPIINATDISREDHISQMWRAVDPDGNALEALLAKTPSPYGEITPLHMLASEQRQTERLMWSFLKTLLLKALDPSMSGFNDVQVLNMHYSESKTATDPATQTLSPYFYLGMRTDGAGSTRARLAVDGVYVSPDATSKAAYFSAPMRIVMSSADLSEDNMRSRSLFGPSGVLYGATAPLVFPSVADHLAMIDQAVLGSLGLGGLGTDANGAPVPSAIDYTPEGSSSSVAQSGYGVGSVKPINPLASSTEMDGFVSGSSSYLLREFGDRSSLTVNMDDEDLGWSLHVKESTGLEGANGTDLSLRSWHQGMAQAAAFIRGLNFRKLAVKTSAHKSMDMFTISEPPARTINAGQVKELPSAPATAVLIPALKTDGSTIGIESYGASAVLAVDGSNDDYNVHSYDPSNVTKLQPLPLLQQYGTGLTRTLYNDADRDNALGYGAWNRFNLYDEVDSGRIDPAVVPTDLWSNRATAMRLRYHVGDFYPGELDARGVPKNLLVDSLNLFVRVEPLSLTHWMTMPKHQHSILENSLVLAEGIEALLKVSHGLGDTKKLLDNQGAPLVTATSPALLEGKYPHKDSMNEFELLGELDPYDLPFKHADQPFIHWYHPAMNELQMPHPGGTSDAYEAGANSFTVTAYPKFGRRSLVIPALVPFKQVTHTLDDHGESHGVSTTSIGPDANTLTPVFPDSITSNPNDIAINGSGVTTNLTVDDSTIPYTYHATTPASVGSKLYQFDDGSSEFLDNNQISFPSLNHYDNGERSIGPVFLPASRSYFKQDGDTTSVALGFNQLLKTEPHVYFNYIGQSEVDAFPFDEIETHYRPEAFGDLNNLPTGLTQSMDSWSTPVMRAPIRTRTVGAIVKLVRTSFETGLNHLQLPSDYDYTMPTNTWDSTEVVGVQTPAVGPDMPTDTLFMGDMGTALGGYSERVGFMSPLMLGVGALHVEGGLLHNSWSGQSVIRDAFDAALHYAYADNASQPVLNTFWALQNQGLQQKLLFNSSFRVLHHRPSGGTSSVVSGMPKSLTEAFIVKDRRTNTPKPLVRPTNTPDGKPFLHLASMHPASAGINNQTAHPNYDSMSHLYPMVSDGVGGMIEDQLTAEGNPNFTVANVRGAAMGDTFSADPYDYISTATFGGSGAQFKASENAHQNSGIEIELLSDLSELHLSPNKFGLNGLSGGFDHIDTMPTANELTLPGDHEIVFVLYTGHYGAKLFDQVDKVDTTHTPSVAGCHLTATIEINRPSERVDSSTTDEHHYGATVDGAPVKTYSILGSK